MPDTQLALLPTKIDNKFVKDEYLAGICNFRTLESGLSRDQKKGDKSKEIEKIFLFATMTFLFFLPLVVRIHIMTFFLLVHIPNTNSNLPDCISGFSF